MAGAEAAASAAVAAVTGEVRGFSWASTRLPAPRGRDSRMRMRRAPHTSALFRARAAAQLL